MAGTTKTKRRSNEETTLVDTEGAARLLGLSPRTLSNYRVYGTGPRAVKRDRLVRYRVDDLESWSKGRSRGAQPRP